MVSYRTRGIYSFCLLIQLVAVTLLFWVWLPISQRSLDFGRFFRDNFPIYNLVLILGLIASPRPPSAIKADFYTANHQTMRQLVFAFALLFAFIVVTKDLQFSRVFGFGLIPLLYLTLLYLNRTLPQRLASHLFKGAHQERVVLVGSSRKVPFLQSWLESKAGLGYKAVGVLCDDSSAKEVSGFKVLGGTDEIERVVREFQITQVVMVEFPLFSNVLSNCASICEKLGTKLLVFCDFESKFHHPVSMLDDEGLRFISLRQEPLEDPFHRFCKRALDICISLPVVLMILPVINLIVWGFQKWQSPGPLVFRQPRAGLQNRPFSIYKYRTMHVHNPNEAKQATEGDSRIYPAGRWFRKLSIDELPQFRNVLKGEMSVVGPRPHLIEHNEQFARALHNYHVRAHVKPGITGLAQVKGFRGETKTSMDVIQRVKADIYYLENWSLSMDISIIFKTYGQVLFPPKSAR